MEPQKLGIDIIEVERFNNLSATSPLYTKLFSAEEMRYCQSRKNPAESFAGIFAAKEAVKKALSAEKIEFADVTITHQENGAPQCAVRGWERYTLALSIAHSGGFAIAACIANEKK